MRLRRFVLRWTVILGVLYVVITALALLFENKLVYPGTSASSGWNPPIDPATEDVWLATAAGTKIHGWYYPCAGDGGAILFSHGNGGNISGDQPLARRLKETFRRPVLIYDYPGYGKSEGKPSEAGCYEAGELAHRWLVESKGIPADRIILFGQSLGGGVTIELGQRVDSEAMILISTFETLPKAAKAILFFLPCEWLMANRFDSIAKLPNYRKPVFIAHGNRDATIPFVQGERLFEVANEPKRFRKVEGGTHNDIAGAELLADARQFLEAPITPSIP